MLGVRGGGRGCKWARKPGNRGTADAGMLKGVCWKRSYRHTIWWYGGRRGLCPLLLRMTRMIKRPPDGGLEADWKYIQIIELAFLVLGTQLVCQGRNRFHCFAGRSSPRWLNHRASKVHSASLATSVATWQAPPCLFMEAGDLLGINEDQASFAELALPSHN
jgi:hypothetical protein